jgi:energy-coupling factor transporter ATP-binding protein EcfA2
MEGKFRRDLIDELARLGVGASVELPELGVVGDTSSGKSSLLAALTGVAFPSDSKIATRCPTRVRMERSPDAFRCTVAVRWVDGKGDPFGPVDVKRLEDVGAEIRRAQEHIIRASEKAIARDVVEVSIVAPDAANLAVVDLPGLVTAVGEGEDRRVIEETCALVEEHLRNSRTVILAVCPASVDLHNHTIVTKAERADPSRERTMLVLTKPDLVDKGAEGGVLKLLDGRDFKLPAHVVKGRGQQDLNDGMTIADGLLNEEEFFATVEPWRTRRAEDPSKFGVAALREALATKQDAVLRAEIPAIRAEIAARLSAAEETLARLGPDVDTPELRAQAREKLMEEVVGRVRAKLLRGSVLKAGKTLQALLREEEEDFGDGVAATEIRDVEDAQAGDQFVLRADRGVVFEFDGAAFVKSGAAPKDAGARMSKAAGVKELTLDVAALMELQDSRAGGGLALFPSEEVFASLWRRRSRRGGRSRRRFSPTRRASSKRRLGRRWRRRRFLSRAPRPSLRLRWRCSSESATSPRRSCWRGTCSGRCSRTPATRR